MAWSAAPALMRGESMSSMRSRTRPFWARAESQAITYVRALPMCWAPVGDGASRPTIWRRFGIIAACSLGSAKTEKFRSIVTFPGRCSRGVDLLRQDGHFFPQDAQDGHGLAILGRRP